MAFADQKTFNLELLQDWCLNKAPVLYRTDKGVAVRNLDDAREYIKRFIFQLNDGNIAVLREGGTFQQLSPTDAKNVYFNRLEKELGTWFFKSYTKTYEFVCELGKPRIYDDKLNTCKGFKHANCKPYNQYDEKTRGKVDLMLNHIREVMASGDESNYTYIVKWIANMAQGNKNDSILYFKSEQGAGKSSLTDFLMHYVIGDDLASEAKSDVLTTSYNKLLLGKLLAVFEELPTFTSSQWQGVSSALKSMITSNTMTYSDKYEKAFTARNINNYIINTNVDALTHSEGRRIYIADISMRRIKDFEYFEAIKTCHNNTVGEAFFAYLLEVDVKGFNAQRDMPDTSSKRVAIALRLEPHVKFLKERYLLQNKGVKAKTADLYEEFQTFCRDTLKKPPMDKRLFYSKLEALGVVKRKTGGKEIFEISLDELKKLADKFKWVDQYDEFEEAETETKDTSIATTEDLDNHLKRQIVDMTDENEALKESLEARDQQIEALNDLISKLTMELRALKNK